MSREILKGKGLYKEFRSVVRRAVVAGLSTALAESVGIGRGATRRWDEGKFKPPDVVQKVIMREARKLLTANDK